MDKKEFDWIVEAARKLRERDKYHEKKLPEVRLTYWDADSWRLKALSEEILPVRIKTRFGYTLEIYPELSKSEKTDINGEIVIRCDGSHVVDFQFASEAHLSAIGMAASVFEGMELFELEFDGKEAMIDYCRKMDSIIVETAKDLNKKKVGSVFEKLWREFGGAKDRLVNRIEWYRDLASLYQADKSRWKAEMQRVGLL